MTVRYFPRCWSMPMSPWGFPHIAGPYQWMPAFAHANVFKTLPMPMSSRLCPYCWSISMDASLCPCQCLQDFANTNVFKTLPILLVHINGCQPLPMPMSSRLGQYQCLQDFAHIAGPYQWMQAFAHANVFKTLPILLAYSFSTPDSIRANNCMANSPIVSSYRWLIFTVSTIMDFPHIANVFGAVTPISMMSCSVFYRLFPHCGSYLLWLQGFFPYCWFVPISARLISQCWSLPMIAWLFLKLLVYVTDLIHW